MVNIGERNGVIIAEISYIQLKAAGLEATGDRIANNA